MLFTILHLSAPGGFQALCKHEGRWQVRISVPASQAAINPTLRRSKSKVTQRVRAPGFGLCSPPSRTSAWSCSVGAGFLGSVFPGGCPGSRDRASRGPGGRRRPGHQLAGERASQPSPASRSRASAPRILNTGQPVVLCSPRFYFTV